MGYNLTDVLAVRNCAGHLVGLCFVEGSLETRAFFNACEKHVDKQGYVVEDKISIAIDQDSIVTIRSSDTSMPLRVQLVCKSTCMNGFWSKTLNQNPKKLRFVFDVDGRMSVVNVADEYLGGEPIRENFIVINF